MLAIPITLFCFVVSPQLTGFMLLDIDKLLS